MVGKIDITIKGISQGLLIRLQGGTWDEQLAALEERLNMGATFFKGGQAALAVDDQTLTAEDIERARDLLAKYDVTLWALVSKDDESTLAAARMGLAVNLDLKEQLESTDRSEEEAEDELPIGDALVVERTLRSGQKAHHPGHIIVLGNVHPGAEVIAGGHVIVWGSLRGVVHAGAMGSEDARVCALDLAPTQLRIAGHIARSPDDKRRRPVPEMAKVRDGQIEAIPWQKR